MKLLDSTAITDAMQKMVETSNGYIMNGHYYNKSNLVVKPFKIFPTMSSIYDLSLSKKLVLNHALTHHTKTLGDTVVVDRNDPTITYVFTVNIRANNLRILKLQENNGAVDFKLTKDLGANPTTNPMISCYLGQDNTYLYFIMSCITFHDYFVKIDKTSLAMTIVEDLLTYAWTIPIKETATHIYYGVKQGYNTNSIKRYNKTTNTIEIIPTAPKTGNYYFSTRYTLPITVSDSEMYMYGINYIIASSKLEISRYKMDTTQAALNSILVEEVPTITWDAVTTKLPILASNGNIHYEPFITIAPTSGKKYLNIAIYEIQNSSTVANLPSYGIYTFLIDIPTNTLVFKSFTQPAVDYFRGALSLKDGNHLVCATPGSVIFMVFNESTEKFITTNTISNIPYHIGIDQSDTVFIVDATSAVDYHNVKVPINVSLRSEKSNFDYQNATGNTYCVISCQNYTGTQIQCKIQLTIKGPALFTDTNSSTIIIDTLPDAEKQIPIKVTGPGPIMVKTSAVQ